MPSIKLNDSCHWAKSIHPQSIRSSSYGHTLGGAIGLSMIDATAAGEKVVNKEFLETGKWEIEIFGKKYPCKLSLRPLYDPNNLKIKI